MIYIVTHKGFFGQKLMPWDGMDLYELMSGFLKKGIKCKLIELNDLEFLTEADLVITGSFQVPGLKKMLEDKLWYLSSIGVKCVPSYELVLAHENKGIQSLLKKKYHFDDLNEKYLSCGDIVYNENVVYKKTAGAGSHGVALPQNPTQLHRWEKNYKANFQRLSNVVDIAKLMIKKCFFFGWRYSEQQLIYKTDVPLVNCQNFVPSLEYDFKILVFYDRVYALKRNVRDGDFRASGSGKFEIVSQCPDEVLSKALEVREKLDAPYISVDIAYDGRVAYVIEFQSPHFGPYTFLSANVYFKRTNGKFLPYEKENLSLEEEYVESIYRFINEK